MECEGVIITGEAAGGDSRGPRRLRRTNKNNDLEGRDAISSTGDSSTDVHDAPGLTQLPLSLLRDGVFPFLAPPWLSDPQRAVRDGFDSKTYASQLAPLRAVCQQWNTLAQESKKSHEVVWFSTVTEQERTRVLREAKTNGSMVKELKVEMDEDESYFSHTPQADERVLEMLPLTFWDEFFQCYPETERLDISEIDTRLMDCIVAAAARWLPKVRALILPRSHQTAPAGSDWVLQLHAPVRPQTHQTDGNETLRVVVEALSRWHAMNGGLRVLTIPDWIAKQDNLYADFLVAVTQFCPQIEYLVSKVPNRPVRLERLVTCLPLPVWTDFCHTCSLLRELSWNLVPCTKQNMDIFRTSRKPQLETLRMELRFLDQQPAMTDLSAIQCMVAELPTLRSFELDVATTPRDIVFSMSALDELVVQLATSCPQLETFQCLRMIADQDMIVSSATLQALVKNCSMLRTLSLNSLLVSDSDDVLVDMLKNMRLDGSATDDHFVDITAADTVNAAVLKMLEFLVETNPAHASFAQTKATLQFRAAGRVRRGANNGQASLEKDTLPSRQKLEKLVEAIIFRYADTLTYLRVVVHSHYIGHRAFDTIETITLRVNVDQTKNKFFEGWSPSDDNRTDVDGRGGVFYY